MEVLSVDMERWHVVAHTVHPAGGQGFHATSGASESFGDDQELRRINRRRCIAVCPRLDRGNGRLTVPSCPKEQAQLPRRVAPRPQGDLSCCSAWVADLSALVADTQFGVEVGLMMVPHGKIGIEGTQREQSSGPQHRSDGPQHCFVFAVFSHHPEGALAQAHGSIDDSDRRDECGSVTGVNYFEPRRVESFLDRPLPTDVDERRAYVDSSHSISATSKLNHVSPWAATDIEDRHRRIEFQRINEIVDLLRRALRERIAQVCLAHVVGELFEPMPSLSHVVLRLGRRPRIAPRRIDLEWDFERSR